MTQIPDFVSTGLVTSLVTLGNSLGLYLLHGTAPIMIFKGCVLSTAGLLLTGTGITAFKLYQWFKRTYH